MISNKMLSIMLGLALVASGSSPGTAGIDMGPADGATAPPEQKIAVTTDQGVVYSTPTQHVTMFKNIPYAQPPIGVNRFMPPNTTLPMFPAEGLPENDVKCWGTNGQQGTEDCLILNVFVPKDFDVNGDEKLPVALHIHGGGYMTGSAFTNPHAGLVDGIVLVSINYRLGAFGFLTSDEISADVTARSDIDSTGSVNGILDAMAALKWVQSQIGYFGGDKDQVTVMGHSAGSTTVCHMMLSPKAEGLFHRAIMQSGWCVGGPESDSVLIIRTPEKAKELSAELLGALGLEGKTLDELREVSPENLVHNTGYTDGKHAWPGYDGYLLPMHMGQLDLNWPMWLPADQIMMGFNTLDITADNGQGRAFGMPDVWPNELSDEETEKILRILFNNGQIERVNTILADLPNMRKVQLISSMSSIGCDMIHMADANPDVKFYVHAFDFDGKERVMPRTQNAPMTIGWATHGVENLDLNDFQAWAKVPLTDPVLEAEIQDDWSSFIKMGPAGVPKWPEYGDDATYKYLDSMYMGMYEDADLFGLCPLIEEIGTARFMFDIVPFGAIDYPKFGEDPTVEDPTVKSNVTGNDANVTSNVTGNDPTVAAPSPSSGPQVNTALVIGVIVGVLFLLLTAVGLAIRCSSKSELERDYGSPADSTV